MSWIIKGETGHTLDATSHTIDGLNISSGALHFQSLARDTLVWTADTSDATGAGSIVPDFGQIVELYWDTARKFRGHVTSVKVGMRQITVTVDGPWWWMERTNLTSMQTDANGGSSERNQYVFPTQSLATSIVSLLTRAVTNGTPMAIGSVAAMFLVPRMTLSEMSCANALATIMAWCPDCVAWFDYSGTDDPVINISRRSAMPAITYTIGTDAVISGEVEPRMDLEVASNEIHYVVRNATTGKPSWAVPQTSGTAAPGKRQIVTVSGPEIVDILPRDDFDSITLGTTPLTTLALQNYDPKVTNIIAAKGALGYEWTQIGGSVSHGNTGYVWMQNRTYASATETPLPSNVAAWNFTPEISALPDWVIAMLTMRKITITAEWYVRAKPPASAALSALSILPGVVSGNLYTGLYVTGYYVIVPLTVTGWITPYALAGTTLYKPWEYDFITPPAGLAANLVSAQNWVPWEGPINLIADDCSGDNLLANKFNLAGTIAPCATMDALAKGITHNITGCRTTIDLGAPARIDFGTLVSRVRQDPKDCIVYL